MIQLKQQSGAGDHLQRQREDLAIRERESFLKWGWELVTVRTVDKY